MAYEKFRGRMIPPQVCADELEVSKFSIHRWIREGKIVAVRMSGRCTRIDGDSLADFMTRSATTPKLPPSSAIKVA